MEYKEEKAVITAFMNQTKAQSRTLKTDGQSLFSFEKLRIAEHIPHPDGGASTLVYDYTYGGGAYVSSATSNHVRLTKKQVPKPNWVSVLDAREVGLVPLVTERYQHGTPRQP